MPRMLVVLVICGLVTAIGADVHAQAPRAGVTMRQFMTPEEFKATGLTKLTDKELAALDAWVTRFALLVLKTGGGIDSAPVPSPGARTYLVEAAVDDETFIINGFVFEAKTYCFDVQKGDRVIFTGGSAFGACASAEFVVLRTSRKCRCWCK